MKYLIGICKTTHSAHYPEDVIIFRTYPPFRDILKGLDYILSLVRDPSPFSR